MLRVLFVSSGNSAFGVSPFVEEQGEALRKLGIHVDFFLIEGKGIRGYVRNIFKLRKYLKHHHYDILHGHFIWSILICLFQPNIIKVGTFPGTDLNRPLFRFIAETIVLPNLALSIVVSNKMANLVPHRKTTVIQYGIDLNKFYPINDSSTNTSPRIQPGKINILFCSVFSRPVKNPQLAFNAVQLLADRYNINLIELRAFDRSEINLVLNLVDLLLMTSFTEGSPQIIKEAMACNCPIVSTNVGDVSEVMRGVDGCYVTSFDPSDVAAKIENAINFRKRTTGRNCIEHFSNLQIAKRLQTEYEDLLLKRVRKT